MHIRLKVKHQYTVWCVRYLQCRSTRPSAWARTPVVYRWQDACRAFYSIGYFFRITEDWKLCCCTELQKCSSKRPQSMPHMTRRRVDQSSISWCFQIVSTATGRRIVTSQCKAIGRHFVQVGTWINPTASCCISYKYTAALCFGRSFRCQISLCLFLFSVAKEHYGFIFFVWCFLSNSLHHWRYNFLLINSLTVCEIF